MQKNVPRSPLSERGRPRGPGALVACGLACVLACALVSCAKPPPSVPLDPTWPAQPSAYDDAYEAWTRHAVLHEYEQQVLEVYATFKSPAWRAAQVAATARTRLLSQDAQAALREQESKAASEAHEMHLVVTTWDRNENDLQKGPNAAWRLSLRDDRGNEVEPISIRRDKRPLSVIRAEYPDMGDFATAYDVRFPPAIAILRQDAARFSLVLSSTRGAVELVWKSR